MNYGLNFFLISLFAQLLPVNTVYDPHQQMFESFHFPYFIKIFNILFENYNFKKINYLRCFFLYCCVYFKFNFLICIFHV